MFKNFGHLTYIYIHTYICLVKNIFPLCTCFGFTGVFLKSSSYYMLIIIELNIVKEIMTLESYGWRYITMHIGLYSCNVMRWHIEINIKEGWMIFQFYFPADPAFIWGYIPHNCVCCHFWVPSISQTARIILKNALIWLKHRDGENTILICMVLCILRRLPYNIRFLKIKE